MPKRIDQYVSENRQNLRRLDATFVSVSSRGRVTLDFGVSDFEIISTITLYRRDLNNSLVSGHPDAKHGSGRGVAGDVRGSWTLETDTTESDEFTYDGADAVADVLTGDNTAAIDTVVIGSDGTTASSSDSGLHSEDGRRHAHHRGQGSASNTALVKAVLRFGDFDDVAAEYGVIGGGSLYNRLTTSDLQLSSHKELRVEIEMEVVGTGEGSSAITYTGEDTVAEAIRRTDKVIGLQEMAFGSGTSDPSKSDTSLDTEEFRRNVERLRDGSTVTAYTVVFEDEPSSQPVTFTEAGVFDNGGNLLWRVEFDGIEKDSDIQLEAFAGFKAK